MKEIERIRRNIQEFKSKSFETYSKDFWEGFHVAIGIVDATYDEPDKSKCERCKHAESKKCGNCTVNGGEYNYFQIIVKK